MPINWKPYRRKAVPTGDTSHDATAARLTTALDELLRQERIARDGPREG